MPPKVKTVAPADPATDGESSITHLQQQIIDFPVGSKHPLLGRVVTGHSTEGNCLFENEEENREMEPSNNSNQPSGDGNDSPATTLNSLPTGGGIVPLHQKSVAALLDAAKVARLKVLRLVQIKKALIILQNQTEEDVDIFTPEILAFDFDEEDTKSLLDLYIKEPKALITDIPSPKNGEPNFTFLAQNIVKLSKSISAEQAKTFADLINQVGDKNLKLTDVTDKDGRELIGARLISKAAFIGLTEEEAIKWESEFSLTKLAKYVTIIFGVKGGAEYKTLQDKIKEYVLPLDTSEGHIMNEAGEDRFLNTLFNIVESSNIDEYDTEEKQKKS